MLRGDIPLQVFNHRWALFLLGLFLAECTYRRAFSLPDTFIGRHLLWGLLQPLSLAWCRALSRVALSLARHFVWTSAQGFWTNRASLLGSDERVGQKRCDYTCCRITPTLIPSITHSV